MFAVVAASVAVVVAAVSVVVVVVVDAVVDVAVDVVVVVAKTQTWISHTLGVWPTKILCRYADAPPKAPLFWFLLNLSHNLPPKKK